MDKPLSVMQAIEKRRTIRKFKQESISYSTLETLIEAARIAPSAANLQPLKYKIVNEPGLVEAVFDNVKWAAYIAPEGNPAKSERPVAFIAILVDTDIKKTDYELDIGAAAQNIFLAALEQGIGTCWMGAINRENIKKILGISEKYILNTVIALGFPDEEPVMVEENGSIRYYKNHQGVLNVPKRKLKDILI